MKQGIEIEKFFFIALGNYITSCYIRDFTLFELLRRPLNFPIKRQNNFYVATVPKGLPWQETVLHLDDSFVTKTKDIPVKKGVQKADDNNNFFLIDAKAVEELLLPEKQSPITSGFLSYSPLYRFITEPFLLNMESGGVPLYLAKAISYVLKSEGIKNDVKKKEENIVEVTFNEKNILNKISVFGSENFDRLELVGENSTSFFDLSIKTISISRKHCPVCFDALYKTGDHDLQNIVLNKSPERIELTYEG